MRIQWELSSYVLQDNFLKPESSVGSVNNVMYYRAKAILAKLICAVWWFFLNKNFIQSYIIEHNEACL
jgi:hypothetical protein